MVDVAITAAALAASLLMIGHGFLGQASWRLDPLGGALAAAATLPLLASRRAPLAVFVVTASASAAASGLGYALWIPLGPTAALYLLAASRSADRPWTWRTTAVTAALFAAYLAAAGGAERTFPALGLLHTGLAWAVAWFAGDRTRLLGERMAELKERAARAEREAEKDRRLAIAEERARIARDLHDSAGHAINVIALRAGAGRLRHPQDPDRSLLALEAIEDVARQTAGDIDEIVHALRDGGSDGAGPPAPPGLASLGTLLAHHSQSGLEVSVRSSEDLPPLSPSADQAAYRILQEALTNAARHGTGTAHIELATDHTDLVLTVINPVQERIKARRSGGHGLVGMTERATLLGGTLEAELRDGTFRVRARIPGGGGRG